MTTQDLIQMLDESTARLELLQKQMNSLCNEMITTNQTTKYVVEKLKEMEDGKE